MKKTELIQSILVIAQEVNQNTSEEVEKEINELRSTAKDCEDLGIQIPIDQQLLLLSLETGKKVNEMLKE